MFKDFKAFLMRGNVLDLAVGIIIGAAFTKIVTSFVGDILTPLMSVALGKMDFSNAFVSLNGESYATLADAKKAGAPTLNLGLFGNAVIDFIIVGFVIFMIVRMAQKLQAADPIPAPNTKECPFCKTSVNLTATKCPACTSNI